MVTQTRSFATIANGLRKWHEAGLPRPSYHLEALLLKSDFGRLRPQRSHELVLESCGIPQEIWFIFPPLAEYEARLRDEFPEYDY